MGSTLLEGHFGGFLLCSFGFFGLLFRRRGRFADLFFFQAVDVNRVIMAEIVGILQFCDFQGDVILQQYQLITILFFDILIIFV